MRKVAALCLLATSASLLASCGAGGSLFNRARPDEFAVTRQAPLVVPPDFALAPPNPGAPRPQDVDSSRQALDALFGGPAPRSAVESDTLGRAGASATGIRSTVGDPKTRTVAKGSGLQTILAAPQGDGAEAQANIPTQG
ncbi:DUF3035 domain-containing protein [Novosphingobium sp. FKTRR1]|uniref:DUF3035 domain-containing protein n=1 Tax=unclassified Novosphingobium TaxID=2644732 RepID=UPI001CF0B421|nr:DUF3035 domain-containing protein [Novosphingobium sp. FKTRR1]